MMGTALINATNPAIKETIHTPKRPGTFKTLTERKDLGLPGLNP
jgi:hypothetical protein